ncbi:hypothetical protein CRG98_011874 [Punica granatum]|uniref:Rab-GAP TBC domain-containing protein n=1 Tax=Punica granatum TaxID=22663 RepID=A0A2I0KGP1_PUNGR|nr:hypothetical protein CRG98_011874 [Punica granatum]
MRWKDECCRMFPVVGSGRYVTAPIITDEGNPIQDPLVLQETSAQVGAVRASLSNGDAVASSSTSSVRVLDKKEIQWKLTLHQIGLDVIRTDRTLVFYEKQQNLSKLWDILAVYAWVDTDIGYCQEKLGGGDYLFAFRMLMVLFRREFSFGDSLYLWEMMWALEYDPDLFLLYEEPKSAAEKAEGSKGKAKSIRQCGKYERENLKNGGNSSEAPLPISVFLVASVLKDRSSKLMTEARGLDDVVKILNDITGSLDAKKACTGAMKLHKKYLKKAKKT